MKRTSARSRRQGLRGRLLAARLAILVSAVVACAAIAPGVARAQSSEPTPTDGDRTGTEASISREGPLEIRGVGGNESESARPENGEGLSRPGSAPDREPAEIFVQANAAYEEGRYTEAAEGYRALAATGLESAAVHYNLGNALLRSGELGHAVASYRRALMLAPRDSDARANLDFARGSTRDDIAPPEPSALARTLFFWHHAASRSELVRIGVGTSVLFWLLLGLAWLGRGGEGVRWAAAIAAIVLVCLLGSIGAKTFWPSRIAVVLPPEVEVRSGTDVESVVRFRLHAGTEIRALQQREGWVRILLPDGQQGWVPSEHVEVVLAH